MGGGNGQKSKTARERNIEKMKPVKGSQLASNKKAMTIQKNSNTNMSVNAATKSLITSTDA